MGRQRKQEWKLEDFKYVDAFHMNPTTGQRTKWERIELDKVDAFRNKYSNYNVFTTAQRYRNKVRQEDGELMYAPLFIDVDSARLLATDYSKKPATPGLLEHGFVHTAELAPFLKDSPQLLAQLNNFDIGMDLSQEACEGLNEVAEHLPDLKEFVWLKNLEASRTDVVRIINYFKDRFEMTPADMRVYFSGSKGFHVLINPIVLGIKPDKNLHRIFKYIMNFLENQLSLQSLDSGVYGKGRQLRLVNSMHSKSGKIKVELTHEELMSDLRYVITNYALAPRDELYPPDTEYELNTAAHEWYTRHIEEWAAAERLQSDRVTLKDEVLSQMEGLPICVQFMLERGILKNGDRNKATMALASYYKDIGTPIGETTETLKDWAKKIPKSMTSSGPSEVQASTISCVKTVYEDDRYHFGCAFIRSLHGERRGKDYEAVPCAGRACPAHEDHAIDKEPAESMHLARTASAEFTGKKVQFDALVSGKMDTPYIVPKKVRYVCAHQPFCEKDCIMHDYDGLYEREFHENERFLIEASNQNDSNIRGILHHYSHAACKKASSEVLETVNVTELLVVPMADRINTVKNEDGTTSEVDEHGHEYVTRRIYAVGDPGDIPQANQHYDIEGYVYSHPKNAMATVLTQKHVPKEDSVAQFKLTDQMKKDFAVFQVQQGEELDDRLDLIINDISANVTKVYERFEPHLATLMTYHSCLNYYFQNQLEKRGWMEVIFVGDSGQAKTQLVNNIMEYAGLGNMISGEGAGRTGLIYRLEQMGERWFITWGKYVQSDRKLMAIDEFNAMPAEDFGKITEARTTGVLKVDRIVNTETNARVRLVLLTNPSHKKTLSRFTHGVESLGPLFDSPADIRRLDLAVFLQSGDVDKSVLNSADEVDDEEQKTPMVSSEVLRNSVLWAWSRRANQIEITKSAMKRILKRSDELAEMYGYSQDIPLMEPADLRKKLARMSIALAALVHSTDEEHEMIIVTPEHVDYVNDFISVVYNNKNARLDVYSAKSREESDLTDEEYERISRELADLDFGDHGPVSNEIIDLFRKNSILKPNEIADMLGHERQQILTRISILSKSSMIERTRDGLRKLPKFIEFLNRYANE